MNEVIRLPHAAPDPVSRLIGDVAAGNHRAFEAVYREMAPRVLRYAITWGISEAAAEDVLQETFMGVWRGAGRFRGDVPGRAWIFSIARRKCADAYRVARAAPTGPEQLAPPEGRGDPEVGVWERLMSLPETDRELAVLVFVDDLGYADVASVLGIPVGTVKSRVFRVRRMLQAEEREGTRDGAR